MVGPTGSDTTNLLSVRVRDRARVRVRVKITVRVRVRVRPDTTDRSRPLS